MAAGIANLSQEIIRDIASYLPRWEHGRRANITEQGRPLLPAYATISRSWQYGIESRTMRKVVVKSTDFESLSRIIIDHRRRLLRQLELNVVLPTYSDKACAKLETDQEKQSNNQIFTKAIKDLFTLLRSWHTDFQAVEDHDDSTAQPLELCIGHCYSPKDPTYRDHKQYLEDIENSDSGARQDLFDHRHETSLLRLESIEDIQELSQITSLKIAPYRKIEPRSVALLAGRFSNLAGCLWTLDDNEKLDTQMRQQTRLDFARALSLVPRNLLKRVDIELYNRPPNNQDMKPPSAVLPSSPNTDHLILAIHNLSQSKNLTHLDLGDDFVISPSLFWPDNQSKQPFWPNLTWVKIKFSTTTPDGDWYFMWDENLEIESEASGDALTESESDSSSSSSHGSASPPILMYRNPDPDVPDIYNFKAIALATGAEPWRHFRSRVDTEKLNPLLIAAAKAASKMPRLQRMTLWTQVRGPRMFNFVMTYFAPGEKMDMGAGASDFESPRLEWLVGMSGYEPEEGILKLWKEAKGEVLQTVMERRY